MRDEQRQWQWHKINQENRFVYVNFVKISIGSNVDCSCRHFFLFHIFPIAKPVWNWQPKITATIYTICTVYHTISICVNVKHFEFSLWSLEMCPFKRINRFNSETRKTFTHFQYIIIVRNARQFSAGNKH